LILFQLSTFSALAHCILLVGSLGAIALGLFLVAAVMLALGISLVTALCAISVDIFVIAIRSKKVNDGYICINLFRF